MRGEELLAGGVFVAIYALIVTARLHRTLAALLGAVIVIILGLIDQHEAFSEEVVVSSLSEARGHPITYVSYLRYGVPATLLSMVICTTDIWVRYVLLS